MRRKEPLPRPSCVCPLALIGMLGYVRTACLALGLVAPTADEPVLRRARGAVAKRLTMTSRHS